MNEHLSNRGISMYLIGDVSAEERRHAALCTACQEKIASLTGPLENFRGAVRNWAGARDRAAEMRWTVIPASDHLARMLLPGAPPWHRSLASNLAAVFSRTPRLLDLTSKPVLVRDIWGQYGCQKKSWVMSTAAQAAAVLLLFTAASTKVAQHHIVQLIAPVITPYEPKPSPAPRSNGGGGGGDRSPLPASKGRLPKAALKQFTPPAAAVNNPNPKLTIEPSIVAPPNVALPQLSMAQYGDPLGKVGPLSNGPGSGGGIGSGIGGGVGPGKGPGFGPGEGGGVGGGIFRVGGGVTAPSLIYKVEPEYSEEARKAKYQGTVVLYVEVGPDGRARNIRIVRSLGLGLDERAIEAVTKWRFRPGYKNGTPVTVAATIEVNFRLL